MIELRPDDTEFIELLAEAQIAQDNNAAAIAIAATSIGRPAPCGVECWRRKLFRLW